MNFEEFWECLKYPLAFSCLAVALVIIIADLRRRNRRKKKAIQIRKDILRSSSKCRSHANLKVTPPEGVTYKWCRLFKGGESSGGEVTLDEDRIKDAIGSGWYPVPYERHQDVAETLDPKKLSIQMDGFILVQDKPLVGIEDKSEKVSKIESVVDDGIVEGKVLAKGAIEGKIVSTDDLMEEYLRTGNTRLLMEAASELHPEPLDYKKVIEDAIERKEDNIEIDGVHDGMQFKLEIKSEGG